MMPFAQQVIARDRQVNACDAEIDGSHRDAGTVIGDRSDLHVIRISRYLERIAAHAIDIAEIVVRMVESRDPPQAVR